jgi:hypothetical protein
VPDILTHEQVMKVLLQISAHERSTPEIKLDLERLLNRPLASDNELEAAEFTSWVDEGDRETSLVARLDAAERKIALLEQVRKTRETRSDDSVKDVTQEFQPTAEGDTPLTRADAARWLNAMLCFCCAVVLGFNAIGGSVPRPKPWVVVCLALGATGVGVSLIKRSWGSAFTAIAVVSGIATIALMIKTLLG